MEKLFGQGETPDLAAELAEWFSVAGDLDDFIYYWDDGGESGR